MLSVNGVEVRRETAGDTEMKEYSHPAIGARQDPIAEDCPGAPREIPIAAEGVISWSVCL